MSLIQLKKVFVSIALFSMLTLQALGAYGFRPFAPYQRDEFGGGPRQPEGMYGSVEGYFLTAAPTKNIIVGSVKDGESNFRWAFTGNTSIMQTNTIDTSQIGTLSGMGTRAEIGNRRGHWGWNVSGYGIPGMNSTVSNTGASVVIDDPRNLTTRAFITLIDPTSLGNNQFLLDTVWKEGGAEFDKMANNNDPISGVGHFWGWYVYHTQREFIVQEATQGQWITQPDGSQLFIPGLAEVRATLDIYEGTIAPLPITFEETRVNSQLQHWSIETNATYRMHPSKLGGLEIIGGARYMQIDDSLNFLGLGSPYKGVEIQYDDNTGEPNGLTGTATGPGSILGNSDWQFQAQNHIIAPQVGMKWSKTNNRWTLSAEGKFMAGINYQNLGSKGSYSSHYNFVARDAGAIYDPALFATEMANQGIYPWTAIGPMNSARSFYHHKSYVDFSPGVEAKVSANWQLTRAVGLQVGVNAMWVDQIAKGAYINDYKVDSSGTLFGLKSSGFTKDALMYGLTFGVTINRF